LHIALTTRDQVYVGVANGLSGSSAAVHAQVKADHRSVLIDYISPKFAQARLMLAVVFDQSR
jgi:shikimate kinase